MVNDSNILILGSSGFIGKYLSDNLYCNSLSRLDVDLTNFKNLYSCIKKYKPQTIINCAVNSNSNLTEFNFDCFYQNLCIYNNLYKLKEEFGKLIHFGSGAEFDRNYSINFANEYDIFKKYPKDHYGLSKNIISRHSLYVDNFYIFRLFGCFYKSENNRLLNKILISDNIEIENRLFDYFWLEDVLEVVKYYLENHNLPIKDINLVYNKKYYLEDFILKFLETHNIKKTINFKLINKNYTGSSINLDSLCLNLVGIDKGIERYFE